MPEYMGFEMGFGVRLDYHKYPRNSSILSPKVNFEAPLRGWNKKWGQIIIWHLAMYTVMLKNINKLGDKMER